MHASDRILVDTSAWINFFRRKEPCYSIVLQAMEVQKVCSAGIIVAELMQGAKSETELSLLKNFALVFDILPDSPVVWQAAGELSFRLRRKGVTVGLADCFIATLSKLNGVSLLTLDSHFDLIQTEVALILFPLEK